MDRNIELACDITFQMWKQVVPKDRKRKKVLKNGPEVYILSPDLEEQPEEQSSKEEPSESSQQMRKRRVRQRTAKRKSPR